MSVVLFLGLCLVAGEAAAQRQFIHPGIYHNRAELDFLKQKIQAGEEPWTSQYQRMITETGGLGQQFGSLSYQPKAHTWAEQGAYNKPCLGGCLTLKDDAAAAYVHSLAWFVTGDVRHAQKSVEILNAWNILTNISGANKELFAGINCNALVNAAEIMRHTWDGWSAADQAAFRNMLNTAFYPQLHNFRPTYNGNWDTLITQAMIGMGVFLDDQAKFDRAVNYFRSGQGKGSLPNYVRPDGTTQETKRDQAHEQMGVAGLCGTAEIAWKQGLDLYGELDNRLLLGVEGTAQRVGNGALSPFWWLPYNHYVRRAGLRAPEAERLALKLHTSAWKALSQRYRPYTLWSQWTHALLPPLPAGASAQARANSSGGADRTPPSRPLQPLSTPWTSPELTLAATIRLDSDQPGAAEARRTVLGGEFVSGGWRPTAKLDRLMLELREGFPAGQAGAIELDMTNLDFDAQVNGTKQHFFNLYADPKGDQFALRNAFFTLRGGNYKDAAGHRGIKVLWRGANPTRHEAAPFGARPVWDPTTTYTWRAEWTADQLVVFLNGERIFGPAVFSGRDAAMPMKYVFLSRDGIENERVWYGFPGPVYQTVRVYLGNVGNK